MKKFLALLLSFLLVFSCVPMMGVFAEGTIEILSATYGYVNNNSDVTDIISSMITDNTITSFSVTDEAMNCTSYSSESNKLVVKYLENGKTKYACVSEGSTFEIPFKYDAEQTEATKTILSQELASSTAEKVWPNGLRGFNFTGLIGSYSANPGNEGLYVSEETFIRLKNMGVNCLRIPVGTDYGYGWTTNTIPADDPMAPYAHQLEAIKVALKLAEKYDMYIVLTAGDIVGRNIDVMYNLSDGSGYNQTLIALWTHIAENFGSHPNLIGYDILNEPNTDNEVAYYMETVLPQVISAIREKDTNTFVIVEPAKFATPNCFVNLKPIEDDKAVYSLHFYWPHQYTHQGIGDYTKSYSYPSTMASMPSDSELYWDKAQLKNSLAAVKQFQETYDVNIFVGEFGVVRNADNNAQWVADTISIWEEYGWDWCYHSYGGYNGWNPTFGANAAFTNVMDGNTQTEALNELENVFSNNDVAAQKDLVLSKKNDNLLKGVTPVIVSDKTIDSNIENIANLTDADFTTKETISLSEAGTIKLSYQLSKASNVKYISFYGASDNYQIYLGKEADTLFDESNLVFTRSSTLSREDGRVITLKNLYSDALYVGFKFNNSNIFEISEIGAYSKLPVVVETLVNVEKFATDNLNKNLLLDVVPTLTAVGGNASNDTKVDGVPVWSPTTDGLYSNTRRITITTSPADKDLKMTYKLAHRTEISNIILACRQNQPNNFGLEYEVYVSDNKAELYNAENCVFVKSNAQYNKGGQLITFDDEIKPIGSYVGFLITGKYNSGYHIGEIGVFGTDAPSIVTVLQTNAQNGTVYDGTEVQNFINNNLANNKLVTATRTVAAENGKVTSQHNSVTTALVDGTYAKRETVTLQTTTSAARMTFTLSHRTKISDLLVVSRENNTGSYKLNYEIYVSDDLTTLYNAENLVFSKPSDSEYKTGGQLISFADDISPIGSYVGFRFTGVYNSGYHIGELGVYGSDIQPLPEVTITKADVQSFISANASENLLQGLTPTYSEGGTSYPVSIAGNLDLLTDGSWEDSSRATFNLTGTTTGNGTMYITYELPYITRISDFAMCCRGYNFGSFGLSYELYFSDVREGLYSEENKVFERLKTDTASGGQVFSLDKEIQPTAKYVGILLTDAETHKYHVGEIMVLGAYVGDCNEDNKVDIRDLVSIKKQAVGLSEFTESADIDLDGIKASSADMTLMRKILLGVF